MSFPRYPKYKTSGVAWLGDVPEHWTPIRYKNVFAEKKSVSGASLPSGSISFGRVVFKSEGILNELTKATYQEVLAGEFLINPINLNYDLKSLRTALSNINTCVSPAYIVLRAKSGWDKTYLKYQLHLFDVSHMKTLGAGVRQTITFGDIGACQVYLPPLSEQTAIAEFLDRETAKIDRLVGEQQRLMELLKEKREVIISRAVTKGLNPQAKMKPSGIEWLGEVPEHWRVMPLGRVTVSKCDGPFGSGLKSEHYADTGVRVIRLQNIRRDGFDGTDEVFVNEDYYQDELNGHDVVRGDLLIAGLGDDKNAVGRACVAPINIEPAMVKADCFRFRLDTNQVEAEYVAYELNASSVADAGRLSAGSTRSRIPLSTMATRKLAVPPVDEQRMIIDFIRAETAVFDALALETHCAIDLLLERRRAVIAAAVTGKINVNPVATKVPA